MPNLEPLLVSVIQAARLMSVGRDHVYRLIASGELPSFELGIGRPLTRIRVTDLHALIEGRASVK